MRIFATAVMIAAAVGPLAAQTPPCCKITAIDKATGVVSAKVNANGNVFAFKASNARLLATLKVDQAVYANFTTHQVSVDGKSACCTVTSGPTAPAPIAPPNGRGGATPPSAPSPAGNQVAGSRLAAIALTLPTVSLGTPHAPSRLAPEALQAIEQARYDTRTVTAMVAGRQVTTNILHLRGLDGIENAPGLPDGARRLLKMHVRTLAPGESDHYIVNVDLARQWIADHPVPADIQPTDESPSTHSGCHAWSMHCAGEVAAHAADQVQQMIDQATVAWHKAAGELAGAWNTVESCFADNTLSLGNVPVKFSVAPGMTVDLSSTSKSSGSVTTSTTVKGSVGLSFPMQSDATADIDLFYIPCLPFVIRPKQVSGEGTFVIGEDLTGSASASGSFDKTFTIPPTGGPKIPIEVYPIVIAGVPVAEMDVSAYIEGNIEVSGQGTVEGKFEIKDPHKAAFSFTCSGHGCSGDSKGMPDPTTATESADIKGKLAIRPDIFTAMQLDFDVDALSARAGPEPYLLGEAVGCAGVNAAQSSNGTSSSSTNDVLAGDLDWGIDLRAEALVAGKVVGNSYRHSFTGNKHLWWRDLMPSGSTALDALVVSAAPVKANKPALIKVRMPSCYPYTSPVQYRITWTGHPIPGANPACTWQATEGTCTGDPTKDFAIGFTFPTAESYTVTVTPIGDRHDNMLRVFAPAPRPTSLTINVAAGP